MLTFRREYGQMINRGNYQSYTDKELFVLFNKKNDSAAYTELFNRYWKRLLFVAVQKLESEDEAEEIVQEVFIRLWNRRGKIELQNSFHTYIASCVKYEILTRIATRQKELKLRVQSEKQTLQASNTTEEWLDFAQTREAIEKAIQQLPEKCRIVFSLSRNDGYTQKQIAEELNISPKTVESHMSKAIRFIKFSIQNFLFMF